MVLQQKLVDFDNEIVLQPANVVALFCPRAKDAAESVEDHDSAADKGTANRATKQTFGSEDAAADEDTAAANTATKQTFEGEDAAADEDTAAAEVLIENSQINSRKIVPCADDQTTQTNFIQFHFRDSRFFHALFLLLHCACFFYY